MDTTGRDGAEVSAVLVIVEALLLEDFELTKVVEVEFEVLEATGVLVPEVDDGLEEPVAVAVAESDPDPEPFPAVEVGSELPPAVLVGESPPS